MRISLCCKAPAATHGARRYRCSICGQTRTTRPRKRGRKKKRARVSLAIRVLHCNMSLRALATERNIDRECLRRRFHVSLETWLRAHPLPPLPADDTLIAMADVLYFRLGLRDTVYGCYIIMLRSARGSFATPAVFMLRRGRESALGWKRAFSRLPTSVRKHIVAVVADGFTGLMRLAKTWGWYFQWCHVHMKRRMAELRGLRNLQGKQIRRRITGLIYTFLETDSELEASNISKELQELFVNPDCPKSIPRRVGSILKRGSLFRTYRRVPDLNLPVTTNSIEYLNQRIRFRFRLMRGVRSVKSLHQWVDIIHHATPTIQCRGYQQTIKIKKKFYRKSVS